MKIDLKRLLINLAVPLAVGGASAVFQMGNMRSFNILKKPPLTPAGWVFPVVWTVLFILMGISSYLITKQKRKTEKALFFYSLQLFFNFCWSIIFFNMESYLFAFFWLIILLALIITSAIEFYKINKTAGLLFIPYILWVIFAGYLNYSIYLLNR